MIPDVTEGYDYALVHLDNGIDPLTSSVKAGEIAAAYRKAESHLQLVELRESDRLEREAAQGVNARFRIVNRTVPGTVSTASTVLLAPVWTAELLGKAFDLGDGRSVTWGSATEADHLARIELLDRHAVGTIAASARHVKAVADLRESGASCLADLRQSGEPS